MSAAQWTSLMPNDLLARLERLRINPQKRKTNRTQGEHLSGKGGTSIEFSDYRDYVAGDDLRYVDWNVFSRLNQPYLKLYAHEEEMQVPILLDASTSMNFEGKFDLARQIAAAFGMAGLTSVEKVSVYSCAQVGQAPAIFPGTRGRAAVKRFMAFLEGLQPGGAFPIDAAIEDVLQRRRGRGVAVVISDFLTFGDVGKAFNKLHGSGLEVFAIQILAPSERNPEMSGDFRFVDSESGQTLDISSVGELVSLYQAHRQALEDHLAGECQKRNGRFLSLTSDQPIRSVVFDELVRKGWLK
ncbi:MAG: DUF58 domain-containing protein [Planctomycetota bacterium]|nr:MAG: DUF58 domain-containing protein [Planctomycetota bacterium]